MLTLAPPNRNRTRNSAMGNVHVADAYPRALRAVTACSI